MFRHEHKLSEGKTEEGERPSTGDDDCLGSSMVFSKEQQSMTSSGQTHTHT